jgi:hypothetical protein
MRANVKSIGGDMVGSWAFNQLGVENDFLSVVAGDAARAGLTKTPMSLTSAGWAQIGIDVFRKPEDTLSYMALHGTEGDRKMGDHIAGKLNRALGCAIDGAKNLFNPPEKVFSGGPDTVTPNTGPSFSQPFGSGTPPVFNPPRTFVR